MDTSEIVIFVEDLVMYVCRKTRKTWWKPKSWKTKPRNVPHDKFTDRIGDVVFYLIQLHWFAPEELCMEFEFINEYFVQKFFRYGYQPFNVLDYCAQLLSYGIKRQDDGYLGALDFCAHAMERTISRLVESEGVADIWGDLRQMAERFDIEGYTFQSHLNVFNCGYY